MDKRDNIAAVVEKVSPQILEKIKAIQSTRIVQPILEYLKMYGLERVVSFVYHGTIMDVDVLAPKFDAGTSEIETDLETAASLLKKHNIDVPYEIRAQQNAIQKRKDLHSSIKHFENWLIAHMVYADLEEFGIESIYYSPRVGILVKFWGYEPVQDVLNGVSINKVQQVEIVDSRIKPIVKRKRKSIPTSKKDEDTGPKIPLNEWKKTNPGYLWVKEQLLAGRARKDIIVEFNEKHRLDPFNYSTRDGKELSGPIISHWAKMIHQDNK